MKNTVCEVIGTIIGRFAIWLFAWAFAAMLLWNNFIAYEFNILLRACIIYFKIKPSTSKDA